MTNEQYMAMLERVAKLEVGRLADQKRLDTIESAIQEGFSNLSNELKTVTAWMNQGKGWAAATLLLAGAVGAILTKVGTWFLSQGKH